MVRAIAKARTPKLIDITTIKSAKGRKLSGPLKRIGISPYALNAKPFRTRSQDMPSADLHMPAAMAKTPAATESLLRSTTVGYHPPIGVASAPAS